MFEQKRALEFKQRTVLAHAQQRNDEIELQLVRRRWPRLATATEGFLRRAHDRDNSFDFSLRLRRLDATRQLLCIILIERDKNGNFAFAASIRALPASAATCTSATAESISVGES